MFRTHVGVRSMDTLILNVGNAKARLDQADFNTAEVRSGNQNRNMGIVNESGLYDVILDSRKPEALQNTPAGPS